MSKQTRNIIDYLHDEFASFEEKPFSAVDSLVLSTLSYFHFDMLADVSSEFCLEAPTIHDLFRAEDFAAIHAFTLDATYDRAFFPAVAASPRFRNLRLTKHVDVLDELTEKQFSATTFILPDESCFLAFRGTDSTFVGWQEDFNMAFMHATPSQNAAVRYLVQVAEECQAPLRIGGHSKGGNLAVFSAATCECAVQDRILAVYTHDGPGFSGGLLESEGFARVADRVHKTLPESSIIGMLLERQEHYAIVKSDNFGIMQHMPYSWQLEGDDYLYADKISGGAQYVNETLSDWITSLDEERLSAFVKALFSVIEASGVQSVTDFKITDLAASVIALKDMDPEMRKVLINTFKELATFSFKNLLPIDQTDEDATKHPTEPLLEEGATSPKTERSVLAKKKAISKRGHSVYTVMLTGGIGSGKSTVSHLMQELGAETLSLDEIAQRLLDDCEPMKRRIVDTFGTAILTEDGEISRPALAREAFVSAEQTERLNAITFPYIIEAASERIIASRCLPESRSSVLVVEVPLLDKVDDFSRLADEIVAVVASKDVRLARAIKRGGTPEDVEARMEVQATDEQRIAIADSVIENEGSLFALEEEVKRWWQLHEAMDWQRSRVHEE